jgi:putative membrane protein
VSADERRAAETADALRRTRLATERTYLAWWRTAMTAIAVGLGAGAIAPQLTDGSGWWYVGVGIGFITLGIVLLGYGLHRQLLVDRLVARGEFAPPDPRALVVLAVAGAVLGALTIALLISTL